MVVHGQFDIGLVVTLRATHYKGLDLFVGANERVTNTSLELKLLNDVLRKLLPPVG